MRSKYQMGNLRIIRSSSNCNNVGGGRSKPNEGGCRRHPKHRQSPGVCSLCLQEKLSKLSSAYSTSRRRCPTVASFSSSSSSTSSYCSSASSPMHRYEGKGRTSFPFLSFGGKNILTKSRSLAFIASKSMRSKDHQIDNIDQEKKRGGYGFISKLLHPRSNNKRKKEATTGLDHSRTMKDTLTRTRVH